jgi:hypothetical protein
VATTGNGIDKICQKTMIYMANCELIKRAIDNKSQQKRGLAETNKQGAFFAFKSWAI